MSRAGSNEPKAAPRGQTASHTGGGLPGRAAETKEPPWLALSNLRVTAQTRKRYAEAYARFATFVCAMCLQLATFESIDAAAAAFVEELWQSGDPKLWAADTLASLHHYVPVLKRRLPLAWSLLKAWGRHELPARACPIDVPLLFGLCGALLRANARRSALMCVVAYHLLLRTGEMFGVRANDLTRDFNGAVKIVSLGQTKTSQREGVDSAVTVEDPVVAWILATLADGLDPGDRLLDCSQGVWRKQLADIVTALDLTSLHIRGYSLRRGGATFFFRQNNSFDATVERGRWNSLTTARRYLEDAAAQTATLAIPETQRAQLAILSQEFKDFVSSLVGRDAYEASALFAGCTQAGARHEATTPKRQPKTLPPLRKRPAAAALDAEPRGLQRSVSRLLRY